jgi:hypothetical protein
MILPSGWIAIAVAAFSNPFGNTAATLPWMPKVESKLPATGSAGEEPAAGPVPLEVPPPPPLPPHAVSNAMSPRPATQLLLRRLTRISRRVGLPA